MIHCAGYKIVVTACQTSVINEKPVNDSIASVHLN